MSERDLNYRVTVVIESYGPDDSLPGAPGHEVTHRRWVTGRDALGRYLQAVGAASVPFLFHASDEEQPA